jgi:hypothetical protein
MSSSFLSQFYKRKQLFHNPHKILQKIFPTIYFAIYNEITDLEQCLKHLFLVTLVLVCCSERQDNTIMVLFLLGL